METLGMLLQRLRVERELTQDRLAQLATVSIPTIGTIEGNRHTRIRPGTARAIYKALAARKPLHEADAAMFFKLAGIDPGIRTDSDRPAVLDDSTYLQEVAAGNIAYAGSGEPNRPSVPRDPIWLMGVRTGSPHGVPVLIPASLQQIVANTVATVGAERTEIAMRSMLAMLSPEPPRVGPQAIVMPPKTTDGYTVQEFAPVPKTPPSRAKTGPTPKRRAQ